MLRSGAGTFSVASSVESPVSWCPHCECASTRTSSERVASSSWMTWRPNQQVSLR